MIVILTINEIEKHIQIKELLTNTLLLKYVSCVLKFLESKSVVVEGRRGMTLFSRPGFPVLVLNSLLTICQTLNMPHI